MSKYTLIVFLVFVLVVALAGCGAGVTTEDDTPKRTDSFTDSHGRVCTKVWTSGDAIALDCDYPEGVR